MPRWITRTFAVLLFMFAISPFSSLSAADCDCDCEAAPSIADCGSKAPLYPAEIEQEIEVLECERGRLCLAKFRASREARRIFTFDKMSYRRYQEQVVSYEEGIEEIDCRLSYLYPLLNNNP